MESNTPKRIIIGVGIFVLMIIVLMINPFTTVQSQEMGIVTHFGAISGTVGEGLHVINPFTTDVVKIQISAQKETASAAAASKDLQSVSTEVTMNFTLDPAHISDIYREYKNEYVTTIVAPSIQEAVKNATSKYTAEELITKREEVKGLIYEDTKNRLAPHHIIVTELLITNFDFSPAFNQAVEAKVKAEQDALASKNKLAQVQFEAQQKIETAKADAEAIRIQAEAVTQQGGKDYVQLKAIEKWNGQLPNQFVPGSTLPFIKIGN